MLTTVYNISLWTTVLGKILTGGDGGGSIAIDNVDNLLMKISSQAW